MTSPDNASSSYVQSRPATIAPFPEALTSVPLLLGVLIVVATLSFIELKDGTATVLYTPLTTMVRNEFNINAVVAVLSSFEKCVPRLVPYDDAPQDGAY